MHKRPRNTRFDDELAVGEVFLEELLTSPPLLPWQDFLLNPRRLRGSDFLMRWSQGVWSEQRLIDAVKATREFFAIPYGPSGTAPTEDVRAFELYFERLEAAGLGDIKRPDLLIFPQGSAEKVEREIKALGGPAELPFTPEADERVARLVRAAVLAVECENSLWRAQNMPDFRSPLKPQRRLGGRLGLRKNAVLPTIIIKEEDRSPLRAWQEQHGLPIHVWHVFYDRAYGIAFDRAEELVNGGVTEPTVQVFQAPGGATTSKTIYKHYYHHGYPLGESVAEPKLVPDCIEDKNGHILPYVRFSGGTLALLPEALEVLRRAGH
ncbi:MAG: AccI family restriction endonuclease [Verrucomicrobiota bacterium]|jgi:hypothetical protein